MVVVQKTNNMAEKKSGRKLRTVKQKGRANKYYIGDKQISEKEFVKTYTDAVNQGKKVNPDFKPMTVKEVTSPGPDNAPAKLKKESGFKLRSGNKPSIAKLSGVFPSESVTDSVTRGKTNVRKSKKIREKKTIDVKDGKGNVVIKNIPKALISKAPKQRKIGTIKSERAEKIKAFKATAHPLVKSISGFVDSIRSVKKKQSKT